MPTYEFVCPDGHTSEKLYRRMSTAPSELACPVCGKVAVRKISGGAGFVFKGSGFYATDYAKDGNKGMSPPHSHHHEKSASDGDSAESKPTEGKSSNGSAGSAAAPTPAPPASSKPKDSASE